MCLIGLIAAVQCDFFHNKGGSGYGSIAPAYGAPAYGAPPSYSPASSYGAPAAGGYGYGAPAAVPVVYYEEEKVSNQPLSGIRNVSSFIFYKNRF